MRKVIAVTMVLVLACSGVAFADGSDAMNKLGRGFLNILDAVVEIPGTMIRETEAEGAASGFTKGLVMGVGNTVVRAVVGAYEVVTFPLPIPADYEPILDDPQFLSSE